MSAVFQPIQKSFTHDGIELCYFEWGEAVESKPSLLFVHATGFHGRCWDELIERFPDCHCIAYEQHGHGRSEGGRIEHWRDVAAELAAFVLSRGHRFDLAVGHSMGGHSLVTAAALTPVFDKLLLIDPTIFNPESYAHDEAYRAAFKPGQAPSERRRADFSSPEAMMEGLAQKGSFPVYSRRSYEDYCRYGLLEQADGSWRLACEPAVEASVYVSSRSNPGVHEDIASIEVPVHIMRAQERGADQQAGMDFSFSPTWPGLVEKFPNATERHYSELTHFIPMQAPDEVERVMREML